MSRWLKVVLAVVGALALLVGIVLLYVLMAFPKVAAASSLKVQSTPELVARGEYLGSHVAVCLDCHSTRDWTRYSGPLTAGTLGGGGEAFTREMGFPGEIFSKNITPAGIGSWTDGEVARAITSGVSRDGRPMFPIMPYPNYAHLCDADLNSIIAFVRTLSTVNHPNRDGKLDFPMNIIVRTIPSPAVPGACPSPGTPDYGKYMTTIAGCVECHTQQDHGKHKPGMEFAGGWTFPLPGGGHVTSANITPDPETGIGSWTRDEFIARFKAYASANAAVPVSAGGMNTLMPWTMYAGMSAGDLGAIFDYLHVQQAVHNVVERFHP
ncbi:MAG TPA: hypothetical protein VH062_13025 [Polyangiaceae bacterium]|jgi:cytochrome c553|nr:hypothetical protein [Polyangiaceae bacterium]